MFNDRSISEEASGVDIFEGTLINKKPWPHNCDNGTVGESSNLSFIITESPFFSAELLADSWWNVFNERYFRHSTEWTVILTTVYILIWVVGVIGNFLVILVIVLRPQMRSVTNMFIVNLAVADFFVIFVCVPVNLLSNIFQPWILGSLMCKGMAFAQSASVCASAYSLAAVSFDRCRAICSPLVRYFSKLQALETISFIWTIAVLLAVPWVISFDVNNSDTNDLPYCAETWENDFNGKIYFLVANLLCGYFLPLVLISASNLVILCQVVNRKVPEDSASVGPIKRMHKLARHGALKMLGIVTLIFLLSWLPFYLLVTRRTFGENISSTESNLTDILMPFAQWLGSCNSSINPILYAFLNKKFRDMLRSILPRWIPFVHRRSALARMTILNYGIRSLNGTYVFGTSIYPSICATRGPQRSINNSRNCTTRYNYHKRRYINYSCNNTTVLTVRNPNDCTRTGVTVASQIVTEL